jgi:YHS domain-containing protein
MKIAFPRAHATALALLLLAAAPTARAMPAPMQAAPDNVYAPAAAPAAAPAQATPPATTPSPAASTPADAKTTPQLEIAVPPDRTMPVDAVLLRNGKEVPGDLRYVMLYEGTLYLFSSQGTLDLFRADPANFAAQQGGACGRMGPLGGLGDARRYAIEDSMLFFFASEDCMRTFRAKPKLYMEPQDELPAGTPEQQAQGLAAVDRWIAWAGGKQAVRESEAFRHVATRRVVMGTAEWDITETLEITGPHSMHRVDLWNKVGGTNADVRRYEIIATPEGATIGGNTGKATALVDTRRVSFERTLNRQPYAIMRARYRPEAGFLAIKTGEGKIGDADCDYVLTWFDGDATYLSIEKSTGRLVQQGFVGRDEESRNTSLTLDAVTYAGPEALRLPTQWVISRTGEKDGFKTPAATITVVRKAPEPAVQPQAPARPRRPAASPTGEQPAPKSPPMPNPASKP